MRQVDDDERKRHTFKVVERARYTHGDNNDIDLGVLLDRLSAVSLCLCDESPALDLMEQGRVLAREAHSRARPATRRLARECDKLGDESKRAYYVPALTRKRFGVTQVQRGARLLGEAAARVQEQCQR